MIQPRVQFSLANAKEYFREHLCVGDYYSERQKITGEWLGQGAEMLGLKGAVNESAFLALCDGKHPESGKRLGQRMNSVRRVGDEVAANRRIFYDFTIAPPKSVSVVSLFQDDRILALHNRVVRQTMLELERLAETRVRKSGQNGERVTQNIVTACFRHDTSRELDPHLHTHCVVFNATFDPIENRWKALHPAGMYRAQSFATNFYRHELAKGLRALGYEIENHAHGFEIKGVPRSVISRFSKRQQQIDEETQQRTERGETIANVKDLRERVAHGNRRRKLKDSSADRLRPTWTKQMKPDELAALKSLTTARVHAETPADVPALVAWADEHIFERRSVASRQDLMAAALERGRGENFDLAALQAAIEQRDYVHEKETGKLTSREVLGCELEIVVAAHDGRSGHGALAPDYRASAALSAEQKFAVEKILGCRHFISIFSGGAGTGKSRTIQEIERGLAAAKHPVVILAPQRQQVGDLQREGLKAETLSRFLMGKQLTRGAVVILDEAGQVGGRQLRDLIRVVRANGGRLILSGDTRQHGAVPASDALRAITKFSGIKPVVLRQIRRQDPKLGANAKERGFIRGYRAAVKAAARGNIVESFDRLDRIDCIRELAVNDRRAVLAAEYVAAGERKEKTLVVAQTRDEVRNVNDAIRERLRSTGRLGTGTTLATCQPVDLDDAQKRDPRFYEPGQYAFFVQCYGRFAKGELCEITEANERGLVLVKNGRRSTLGYSHTNRIVVAAGVQMEIAPGDRLQLKFNGKSAEGAPLNNGELVTVCRVRKNGELAVMGDDGVRKTLAASQRLFIRGYAVTSYGSQGKTVDTVLFADAANRAATNAQQWYVTISRGRKRVLVFTSDKDELRANVQRAGGGELALELKAETPARIASHVSPQWRLRALDAAKRSQRHRAVTAQVQKQTQRQRIAV